VNSPEAFFSTPALLSIGMVEMMILNDIEYMILNIEYDMILN
jgi:hypothetical protein